MIELSWRARRRLALAVLLVGLPAYVVLAVTIVGRFDRLGILMELATYVGLGLVWVLPLRFVFRGLARPDPNAVKDQ